MGARKKAFQRARRPEQKDLRREQILGVACACFDELGWEGFTMAVLADRAGLAKGTAYRYYATKEALFLDALLAELAEWIEELGIEITAAGRVAGSRRKRRLARGIAATLEPRKRLRNLLAILHPVLEQNIDLDAARSFKFRLAGLMTVPAGRIEQACELSAGEGFRFLLRAHALVVGLTQMASPSDVIAEVLDSDESLAPLKVEFASELEDCLVRLL